MPAATRPRQDDSDEEEALLASPPPKIPRLALEYVRKEFVVNSGLIITVMPVLRLLTLFIIST